MIICKFSPLICSLSLSLSRFLSRSRSGKVRACVGAEPENERKARRRRKIKNSDADGPLAWKSGEKETFSLVLMFSFALMRNTFIDFRLAGRCKKKTTLEPTSLEEGRKRLRSDSVFG